MCITEFDEEVYKQGIKEEYEEVIAAKDELLGAQASELAEKDELLEEKEAEIARLKALLQEKN